MKLLDYNLESRLDFIKHKYAPIEIEAAYLDLPVEFLRSFAKTHKVPYKDQLIDTNILEMFLCFRSITSLSWAAAQYGTTVDAMETLLRSTSITPTYGHLSQTTLVGEPPYVLLSDQVRSKLDTLVGHQTPPPDGDLYDYRSLLGISTHYCPVGDNMGYEFMSNRRVDSICALTGRLISTRNSIVVDTHIRHPNSTRRVGVDTLPYYDLPNGWFDEPDSYINDLKSTHVAKI